MTGFSPPKCMLRISVANVHFQLYTATFRKAERVFFPPGVIRQILVYFRVTPIGCPGTLRLGTLLIRGGGLWLYGIYRFDVELQQRTSTDRTVRGWKSIGQKGVGQKGVDPPF